MITREQAEQASREHGEQSNLLLAYDVRNIHLEPINTNDIGSGELPPLDDFYIELEDAGWLVTYEKHYKYQSEWHIATGRQNEWFEDTCYVVEAKPGPFVIE